MSSFDSHHSLLRVPYPYFETQEKEEWHSSIGGFRATTPLPIRRFVEIIGNPSFAGLRDRLDGTDLNMDPLQQCSFWPPEPDRMDQMELGATRPLGGAVGWS